MVLSTEKDGITQIRLVPNCSATWRQTRLVIFALGGLTLAIAIFWTFMGAWVILPFAGLEAGLLFYLTYRVCLETYHQEVLYISDTAIEMEYGKDFPKKRWSFDRAQSEVEVINPHHSLSPPEILIKSSATDIPVGERLNMSDKEELLDKLVALGIPYRKTGKVSTIAIDGFDLS